MSGHSHYATTHRQKELKDAAKGQIFSKLARTITIAAKTGGGTDPDSNFKLRIAIDKARAVSMPKENIDRAISKAESGGEALDEVLYEGFGPSGIAVLVEVATDNRNRTNSEIKNLFEKNGGKMGSPGSVSFNFEPKGLILITKGTNPDEQMLALIDLGADDIEIEDRGIRVYVDRNNFSMIQKKMLDNGFNIISVELIYKPKTLQELSGSEAEKVKNFLDNIKDNDDVQQVFTNTKFV